MHLQAKSILKSNHCHNTKHVWCHGSFNTIDFYWFWFFIYSHLNSIIKSMVFWTPSCTPT